jgi:DNA repair exonuclease SbcCD nuclease subunit
MKEHFFQKAISHGIEVHVIVGNHDIPFRNTNTINAMSELFGDFYNDRGIFFYDSITDITVDNLDVCLIPWINSTNEKESLDHIKNTKAQVVFGHLELTGFEMYRGMVMDHGMDTAPFDKFDMVMSGHFHHKSKRGNIQYLGTPYELTWSDYNDNRGFHIFNTDTRELEFIQNPNKMFYKIWYDDTIEDFETKLRERTFAEFENTFVKIIVQNKLNPYLFDLMLDKIYKINPANLSIVDDNKNMDQLSEEEIINEAEDTLTTLNNFIGNMNTTVNKKQLKLLLSSLYNEAQNMDLG